MPSDYNGPILPVNKPPRKKKSSGGPGTIILLLIIAALTYLIVKSALNQKTTYTPGTVKDVNAWAYTGTAIGTPEPELRPTAEATGKLPIYYKANTDKKQVALTVQGISSASELDKLLGLCGTYGAHITFFLSGAEVNSYASMLPAAVLGGHEIESCGYSDSTVAGMNSTELSTHIDGFTAKVRSLIGAEYTPHFFRPADISDYDNLPLHEALTKRGYYGIASWAVASPTGMDQIQPGQIIAINLSSYGINRLSDMFAALQENGYALVTMNALFAYPENLISSENG